MSRFLKNMKHCIFSTPIHIIMSIPAKDTVQVCCVGVLPMEQATVFRTIICGYKFPVFL